MRTIGLIGGISCESTAIYYRIINQKVNTVLGKHNNAKIMLVSLNFNDIVEGIFSNNWEVVAKLMIDAAKQLERAGVDFIAICSHTLYKVAPSIQNAIHVPLLHILDPVVGEIKARNLSKIGLLGTKFTMEGVFHTDYLRKNFAITPILPNPQEKEVINRIIFDELCRGIVRNESKEILFNVVESLKEQGAEGVILACTELPLLLPLLANSTIPVFDATALHANAIAVAAINNNLIKA